MTHLFKTLLFRTLLLGFTLTSLCYASEAAVEDTVRDYRALVTISDPYLAAERGFLHYTSHPSDRLLKFYQNAKGKISLQSREDLVSLQARDEADVLCKNDSAFVFDFSAAEIAIGDIGRFGGWDLATTAEATKRSSLKGVASKLFEVLGALSKEQVQETTVKARALLGEAKTRRTPERSGDFKITEGAIFSDGDVEINATDVISAGSKFIFAANSTDMERLLNEIPASASNVHFILGYPDFFGFYSASIGIIPSLEIISMKNLVIAGDLKTAGNLAIDAGNGVFLCGMLSVMGGEMCARSGPMMIQSMAIRMYDSGDKKLVMNNSITRIFSDNPEILPSVFEFLCRRFGTSGIILRTE